MNDQTLPKPAQRSRPNRRVELNLNSAQEPLRVASSKHTKRKWSNLDTHRSSQRVEQTQQSRFARVRASTIFLARVYGKKRQVRV